MFDVDALSFDGDGTLWDHERAMREALGAAVEWFAGHGLRHSGGPVTAGWLRDVRDRIAARSDATVSMEQIRWAAFSRALSRCVAGDRDTCDARDRDVGEVFDLYMSRRSEALRPFDEVEDALGVLAQRYPIALVTNGNTWPAQVGLADRITVVVNAAEVGVRKPDPSIFGHACAGLGVAPDRCLHVGDDPVDDVAGGRAAGMPVVWCNRTGAAWDRAAGAVPVAISSLREFDSLLLPKR